MIWCISAPQHSILHELFIARFNGETLGILMILTSTVVASFYVYSLYESGACVFFSFLPFSFLTLLFSWSSLVFSVPFFTLPLSICEQATAFHFLLFSQQGRTEKLTGSTILTGYITCDQQTRPIPDWYPSPVKDRCNGCGG